MTFKEFTDKFPMLVVHDYHQHPQKSDPSAESEWWYNLISYRGYKFASHIHELRYGDGSGKLFIYYSSLTMEQFKQYLTQDDFWGDFARQLQLIYPFPEKIFGKPMVLLDTDENLTIFSEVLKHIDTLPAVANVKANPTTTSEEDDDE